MATSSVTSPEWSHEGKDGKSELIFNLADDPNDSSGTVINVRGRNSEAVVKALVALLNAAKFSGAPK